MITVRQKTRAIILVFGRTVPAAARTANGCTVMVQSASATLPAVVQLLQPAAAQLLQQPAAVGGGVVGGNRQL